MTVDALRDTLAAQGIDEETSARQTLGALSADPIRMSDVSLGSDVDFEIGAEIGRGGMGVVEAATQRTLGREVAIKRVPPGREKYVDALLREARLTGRLEHPNIVPVHTVVATDRGPAVVMKKITGVEWQTRIDDGSLGLDEHLDVFMQVCRAVAFAHSRRVVHRDIKPTNVMIGEFGEVYLMDWGLARPLVDGVYASERLVGTPAYLAPEMIDGRAEPRSDVFLLGATLHEVLTGESRNAGGNLLSVLTAARAAEPHEYDASVPAGLASICNRACARDLEARFGSVEELLDAVRLYLRRRASESLSRTGETRAVDLRHAIESGADYADVQRAFNEARFAFDQALERWDENERARAGREACLADMATHELELGHPENAAALLDAMEEPAADLRVRVEELREARDAERRRLRELERDRDPHEGAEERSRATFMLAATVVLLVGTFVSLRVFAPQLVSGSLRLTLVGSIVLAFGLAIALRWRARAPMNLINRRIVQVVIGTLVVSLCNRTLGWVGDASVQSILQSDAVILFGGGLALSPFHVSGRAIASLFLAVAAAGALRPAWLEPLFIGSAAIVSTLVLIQEIRR